MGHIRLGRLPKTYRWRQVVELVDEAPSDVSAIAAATVRAAELRLRRLANDPSVSFCFWLLTRITQAARSEDFPATVATLGVDARDGESILTFISRVSNIARREVARHGESGHFAELASLALRKALTETVGEHGGSLFGSSVDDLQSALRAYSTDRSFGRVSRRFFGEFMARMLASFVERELANHVGPSHGLSSLDQSSEFSSALDLYTRQSARIVEDFAADWYSRRNWLTDGQISPEEAQRFVAVALRKLRTELTRPDA